MESTVTKQIHDQKYDLVLKTLRSQQSDLSQKQYLPDAFKQNFNGLKTKNQEVVSATRAIFNMLTHSVDDIMKNRLTTVTTLLTSLVTSLTEELRLELEQFNEEN